MFLVSSLIKVSFYSTWLDTSWTDYSVCVCVYSTLEDMLIDFREKGREGEREKNIDVREKHQLPLTHAPTWDWNCNLDMYPDKNQTCNLSVYWTMLQPNETHWPGQERYFKGAQSQINEEKKETMEECELKSYIRKQSDTVTEKDKFFHWGHRGRRVQSATSTHWYWKWNSETK